MFFLDQCSVHVTLKNLLDRTLHNFWRKLLSIQAVCSQCNARLDLCYWCTFKNFIELIIEYNQVIWVWPLQKMKQK